MFPAPALAEQAAARKRSARGSRPLKWADWEEAVADITNADLRDFLESELSDGRENYLRRRGLHYRLAGKRRFSLYCRRKSGYVWQRGRFEDDQRFWQERLSESGAVKPVKAGKALSFSLHSAADIASYKDAFTKELGGVAWLEKNETTAEDFESEAS